MCGSAAFSLFSLLFVQMAKLKEKLAEMRRLYEVEGMAIRKLAVRFDASRQAVHYRLVQMGVVLRPAPPRLDRNTLQKLYIDQRLSANKIAQLLKCPLSTVYTCLEKHGIERRRPPGSKRKHPELGELKVGESLIVPRPNKRQKYQTYFYSMAKLVGIRVSVKTMDERSVRLTRVE